MFQKFTRHLSGFMVSYGGVSNAELEIYTYGLETLMIRLLHLFTILMFGILVGLFKEAFLFVIVTFMIRRYSGGFHAKTKLTCYLLSLGTTAANFCFSVLIGSNLTVAAQIYLITVCWMVMMILSPQDYETKRLDSLEKVIYGRRARIFLTLVSSVAVLSVIADTSEGRILVGVLLINCFMLIYSYIYNIKNKK